MHGIVFHLLHSPLPSRFPFSRLQVDTAVARHIFQECILGELRNKVRILVTHQTQLLQDLSDRDRVLILGDGGRVEAYAPAKEVLAHLMSGVWRQQLEGGGGEEEKSKATVREEDGGVESKDDKVVE